MGSLLILLGLGAAGLVADYVVENDLTTAPSQSVNLLGGHSASRSPNWWWQRPSSERSPWSW